MKYTLLLLLLTIPFSLFSQSNYLFEENRGQWHEDVQYRTEIPGGYLYITKNGLKYLYFHPDDIEKFHGHNHSDQESHLRKGKAVEGVRMQAIEVVFENSSGMLKPEPLRPAIATSNYFLGNDPNKWATDVRKFEEVVVKDVYDKIDFRIYSNENSLKYDFIVRSDGKPSDIRMAFDGVSGLKVQDEKLEVSTDFSRNAEGIPFSYQSTKDGHKEIRCSYSLKGQTVGFKLEEGFNSKEDLIIDPELIFSTYSGSLADNWGFTATYDLEGNLYSGGIVFAPGFPITNGAFQQFFNRNIDLGILKFNENGTQLLYATYIGGSEAEVPHSMIVNSKGELVIFGTTSSPDFPILNNAYQDEFLGGAVLDTLYGDLGPALGGISYLNGSDLYVLKLSNDGKELNAATFLGGSENDGIMLQSMPLTKNYGDQFRGEVNLDENDNIYLASYSASLDFPIINAVQPDFGGGITDGVVVKFNPDLSELLMSTYLGGEGMDGLYSVKIDSRKSIIVAGGTNSDNYPVSSQAIKKVKTNPLDIDGVVSKISVSGDSLEASTFIGTDQYDQVYFVELDSTDRIYILGQTQGDFLISEDIYSNPNSGQFIQSLGSELDTIFFSTVFGSGSGSPDIRPTAFLVNECQNILISGWGGDINAGFGYVGGNTFDLPVSENAYQKRTDGSDFYIMVLLKDAKQLLYATYFGEFGGRSEHVDGGTSRFDNRGIVYQSVCASCRGTNGFPTTPGAWSSTNNSTNCNNAVFKFDVTQLEANFETNSFEYDMPGLRTGCWPLEVAFLNTSIGGISFEWDFGNGITSNQKDSLLITYEDPGFYNVSLKATDIATCVREDIAYGSIEVYDQTFSLMEPEKICYGDELELEAGGGVFYRWSPEQYLSDPFTNTPLAKPDTTTYFTVEVTNGLGCIAIDSVLIEVVPDFQVSYNYSKENDCYSSPEIVFQNLSKNVEDFHWDLGNGETSSLDSLKYNYQETDTFQVTLSARLDICEKAFSQMVPSVETKVPNIITPNNDGKNDTFEVITDEPIDIKIVSRWGNPVFEKENYQNDFGGSDQASGVYYYEITFSQDGTSCNGWLHILK